MRQTVGEMKCGKHRLGSNRYERWLKKYSARIFRRFAKRQGEDAPTKYRYRGYSD